MTFPGAAAPEPLIRLRLRPPADETTKTTEPPKTFEVFETLSHFGQHQTKARFLKGRPQHPVLSPMDGRQTLAPWSHSIAQASKCVINCFARVPSDNKGSVNESSFLVTWRKKRGTLKKESFPCSSCQETHTLNASGSTGTSSKKPEMPCRLV